MLSEDLAKRLISAPSVACNSPKRIYNKYLRTYMYVPCRHCSSCLDVKSSLLHQRVDNECNQHAYSIFFTLTYDNEHLPTLVATSAKMDNTVLFASNRPFGPKDDYFYLEHKMSYAEFKQLHPVRYTKSSYCFGVVCKYDIQRFLKKLRTNIFRKVFKNDKYLYDQYGKVRYFISSEYGPNTYRPHYHGIIWSDNKDVANLLIGSGRLYHGKKDYSDSLIYQSWQMCNRTSIDASIVTGDASSYVASYCNGYTDLPKILQTKFTSPFVMASKNPIIGSYSSNEKEICYCLANGIVDLSKFEDGIFPDNALPLQIFRKYFGFPKRCYQLSSQSLLSLYEKYDKGIFRKPDDGLATDKGYPLDTYLTRSALFNPADYSFYLHVKRFCTQSHTYYYLNDDGSISSYTAKYPWYVVVPMIYALIRSYSQRSNEIFYFKVNHCPSSDYNWLSQYCNILAECPLLIDDYDEFFDRFGLSEDIFNYLYYYDFKLCKYHFDTDFRDWLMSYNMSSFIQSHKLHIKHSLCTKVFNDH